MNFTKKELLAFAAEHNIPVPPSLIKIRMFYWLKQACFSGKVWAGISGTPENENSKYIRESFVNRFGSETSK